MMRTLVARHGRTLVATSAVAGMLTALTFCGAPAPFVVSGPATTGNDPPILTITEPNENFSIGQKDQFVIEWTDSDRDSNASISFSLIDTATNDSILLIAGIEENDLSGPSKITVQTDLIPFNRTYNLRGVISDGVNVPSEVFAMTTEEGEERRVQINVTEPGQAPPTSPPQVAVLEPAFNRSVAQDDILTIVIRPDENIDPNDPAVVNPPPYDPDSTLDLFILLDLDQDPNNDDPANPDPDKIIVLTVTTIEEGLTDTRTFDNLIDLTIIRPRPGGEPYFIRVTVNDGTNPPIHQYADGTINVVELASGIVDLADIGRDISGAVFDGFSPAARTGSTVDGVSDFDGDGVADFVIVAQYGNPRNFGPIGEAYLIYGRDQERFGGVIPVNSVSDVVAGVLFEAPPIRADTLFEDNPFTNGITDVAWINDLSGDGRPELLFGMSHVAGAVEMMDFDPGDEDVTVSGANILSVRVEFRQGSNGKRVFENDDLVNALTENYLGIDDTSISSAFPTLTAGIDQQITWVNAGPDNSMWVLMKFADVLDGLPDLANDIDFASISATLELTVFAVFGTAGEGAVHQLFTDFDDQVSFSSFDAVNGGAPVAGDDPEFADYATEDLDTVSAQDVFVPVVVDVTPVVIQLILGQLAEFQNELRFIIVPGDDILAAIPASIASSEWSGGIDFRPKLIIEYDRLNALASGGCYPDPFVNNFTNPVGNDNDDHYWYGGGMGLIIDSENRPTDTFSPDRLDKTVVSLELVAQDGNCSLNVDAGSTNCVQGAISVRAQSPGEVGHIAGARFVAGWFDSLDVFQLRQDARGGLFGESIDRLGDVTNDGFDEIVISAPLNERYLADLRTQFGATCPPVGQTPMGLFSTHLCSTQFFGSIVVLPGRADGVPYNDTNWRDKATPFNSSSVIPVLEQHLSGFAPFGSCQQLRPRDVHIPEDRFEVFAEHIDDRLGDGQTAGDFNQDGVPDLLAGAPLNDRDVDPASCEAGGLLKEGCETGAAYILFGRNVAGDYRLTNAGNPVLRPPMLRIRGVLPGDRIGTTQSTGLDVDGDAIDDVFISSPTTDFGGVQRSSCAQGFTCDLDAQATFQGCRSEFEDTNNPLIDNDLLTSDECKAFDYDNDADVDASDQAVFDCLCSGQTNCCDNLVDNGFVAIIFGGQTVTGDRDITQIATADLRGTIFFGAGTGHRAGTAVSSAGDFNEDGFGDLLIAVPGETRIDDAGRERLGVVYLIFGGTHLINQTFSLETVGTETLPGIVFISPYVKGTPNEAPPDTVAFIGDINNDGFGDIAIGNRKADFIDLSFPQGPDAPGGNANVGRRSNAGEVYVIYGNNFGSNR
ncbi:MAG: hypothetical protein IID36_10045 [Planctomycetes bacterium]|nr:hypothetical protein [Planctomycetota bacterium]